MLHSFQWFLDCTLFLFSSCPLPLLLLRFFVLSVISSTLPSKKRHTSLPILYPRLSLSFRFFSFILFLLALIRKLAVARTFYGENLVQIKPFPWNFTARFSLFFNLSHIDTTIQARWENILWLRFCESVPFIKIHIQTANCRRKSSWASINCIWGFSFPFNLYCLLTQFLLLLFFSMRFFVSSIDSFPLFSILCKCLLADISKCIKTHTHTYAQADGAHTCNGIRCGRAGDSRSIHIFMRVSTECTCAAHVAWTVSTSTDTQCVKSKPISETDNNSLQPICINFVMHVTWHHYRKISIANWIFLFLPRCL